jgi:hypothetical protein
MRHLRPQDAVALTTVLTLALSGCQQSDQKLPFEVDPAQAQTVSVNAAGGIVSVPPSFSMEFFSGTLPGSLTVTAQQRLAAFPSDAGIVVPSTAFDVGPSGTALNPDVPARVHISVPSALLPSGQELALTVGLLRPDNSIVTGVTSYDLTNGLLTADVVELGPVAAVISNDAITVGDLASLLPLDGGAITPVSPAPVGPALAPTRVDGVQFTAECSPGERSCLTSGIAQLWVDDIVRDRLGDDIVLVNTTVEASLEFFSFTTAVPDSAVGYLRIDGDLRARINSVIASRRVGDEVALHTGNGLDAYNPDATAISISGSTVSFEFTSQDDPESVEFDVSGVGTSDLLTIQIDGEIEFTNASGPPTVGNLVAQVRLRR